MKLFDSSLILVSHSYCVQIANALGFLLERAFLRPAMTTFYFPLTPFETHYFSRFYFIRFVFILILFLGAAASPFVGGLRSMLLCYIFNFVYAQLEHIFEISLVWFCSVEEKRVKGQLPHISHYSDGSHGCCPVIVLAPRSSRSALAPAAVVVAFPCRRLFMQI